MKHILKGHSSNSVQVNLMKVLKIFEDFSIIVLLCDIHRKNEWEIPHAVRKMCMLLIPLSQPYIISY